MALSLLSTYIGFFTGDLENFEEVAEFSFSYLDHFTGSFGEEPETFGVKRIVPVRCPSPKDCRTAGSTCRKGAVQGRHQGKDLSYV
jgi:hypothetical protein